MDRTTRTYLRELPKAEIHVHPEGCLEPETIERLAEEAGERLPRPRDKLMQFADLSDFLRFLDWSCSLVRTADRLTEAAYASSRRMAVSGAGPLLRGLANISSSPLSIVRFR